MSSQMAEGMQQPRASLRLTMKQHVEGSGGIVLTRSIKQRRLWLSECVKGSVAAGIVAAAAGLSLLFFMAPENLAAQSRQEKARQLLQKT